MSESTESVTLRVRGVIEVCLWRRRGLLETERGPSDEDRTVGVVWGIYGVLTFFGWVLELFCLVNDVVRLKSPPQILRVTGQLWSFQFCERQ